MMKKTKLKMVGYLKLADSLLPSHDIVKGVRRLYCITAMAADNIESWYKVERLIHQLKCNDVILQCFDGAQQVCTTQQDCVVFMGSTVNLIRV